MTDKDLAAKMEAFLLAGGTVRQCAEGDTAIRQVPRNLYRCECGCHGDFTEHGMRAGESGRCSSIIIH